MENAGETVSFGDMLTALADEQRREMLFALLERNPRGELPESRADEDTADAAAVQRLMRMQHVHRPKLAAHGFVDWDREAEAVTKGPNFDEIRPLLELLEDHADELPDDWL